MKKKDKTKMIILVIIGLALISFVVYKVINKRPASVIRNNIALYDYSTKEKAIGASDYVFVGKVNKVLRTEHDKIINRDKALEYCPRTIYSVNVVKNLKRKLINDLPIEIKFDGGFDAAKKTLYLNKDLNLLSAGEYYIFLVAMDKENGPLWLTTKEQLVSLGKKYDAKNVLIKEYEKAYKNEEVPDIAKYMVPKKIYTSIYDINFESN